MQRDDRDPGKVMFKLQYRDAAHLQDQWNRHLSRGRTFVSTTEQLPVGTSLRISLGFPGLRQPILLAGRVIGTGQKGQETGVEVEIHFASTAEHDRVASLIERAALGDPKVCMRLVHVLLVEDNPHIAELVTVGLKEMAQRDFGGNITFDVTWVSDGAAASAAVEKHRFDVLLCDIYLPVMDGAKFIREVRQSQRPDLPVIALSAGGETARQMALEAGCNVFIQKPLRLTELRDALRSLLQLDSSV